MIATPKTSLRHRLLAAGALLGATMALLPPAQAADTNAAGFNPINTSAQMFRWRWNDLAKECTNWLGPQGYGGVQVSPPQASPNLFTWYDVYQPVNFESLNSLMGTEAEFAQMIKTCHAAGVRVYTDVVINHMADGTGRTIDNKFTWDASKLEYPYFSKYDFHDPCDIEGADYGAPGNRAHVTDCRLAKMPDLKTEDAYVRKQLSAYLSKLVALGVDGMRLDAAKHMPATDVTAILADVPPTTLSGEPLWFTQEVYADGNVKREDYFVNGTVNEFNYTLAMRDMIRQENGRSISQIAYVVGVPEYGIAGSARLLDSKDATVFINNWDSERKNGSLNASNFSDGVVNDTVGSKRYSLANILMLAWPYGSAQVHSGYRFVDKNTHPPFESPFDANDKPLINQSWDFIHRWPEISNMIGFRNATAGEIITIYGSGSANTVAFSRGSKGFVTLNNESIRWDITVYTGLPPGVYCNVVHGLLDASGTGCTSDTVTVDPNGVGTFNMGPNDGTTVPAVAIHVNQKVRD